MIKKILKQYENMEVKLPEWIMGYDERNQKEYQKHEKQNWLADKLTEHFVSEKQEWAISDSKDFAFSVNGYLTFVIQRLPGSCSSTRYGGKTYHYLFVVFEDKKEIFSLRNFCDEATYDSNSFRIPVMDLYDVVVAGEKRKPRTAHVCGSQGFNPMLGDSCPACK